MILIGGYLSTRESDEHRVDDQDRRLTILETKQDLLWREAERRLDERQDAERLRGR